MTTHRGQHPRMGTVDVVPFVPILNVTMQEYIQLSCEFGHEFSERFDVLVYLYAESATRPDRKDIDDIRKGEYEALAEQIKSRSTSQTSGPQSSDRKRGRPSQGRGKS